MPAKFGKWVSVKEMLPRVAWRAGFRPVIFCLARGWGRNRVCAGRYLSSGMWESLQGLSFLPDDVTHWMPLPPPPKKGE